MELEERSDLIRLGIIDGVDDNIRLRREVVNEVMEIIRADSNMTILQVANQIVKERYRDGLKSSISDMVWDVYLILNVLVEGGDKDDSRD